MILYYLYFLKQITKYLPRTYLLKQFFDGLSDWSVNRKWCPSRLWTDYCIVLVEIICLRLKVVVCYVVTVWAFVIPHWLPPVHSLLKWQLLNYWSNKNKKASSLDVWYVALYCVPLQSSFKLWPRGHLIFCSRNKR